MSNNKIFVECDCYEHALRMEYDNDREWVDMSIFSRYHERNSWGQRLRHIWYILRYGTPFIDQITLDKEKVAKLHKFLGEYLKGDVNEQSNKTIKNFKSKVKNRK